jgi:hypothetical protein
MTMLVVIVLLTAELPDAGSATFPAICAGFGGFVGLLLGVVRRLPWERIGPLMGQGSAAGYSAGFLVWIVLLAMDRL